MSLAVACMMPFVMLALVFFLAHIESRHLTARPRVEARNPADAEGTAQA